jgi:hypothetical protein
MEVSGQFHASGHFTARRLCGPQSLSEIEKCLLLIPGSNPGVLSRSPSLYLLSYNYWAMPTELYLLSYTDWDIPAELYQMSEILTDFSLLCVRLQTQRQQQKENAGMTLEI